jgi:c-di-GMP-binding flagellar brake protein YcgR
MSLLRLASLYWCRGVTAIGYIHRRGITVQFTDLRIPIATRMQLIVAGADYKPHPFQAQLLGFRAQVSVLAFFAKKPLLPLHTNSNVTVRVGLQSAIVRFESTIQQYQDHPFAYLHLAYPGAVEIEQQLRRAPRFNLDVPIKATVKTTVDDAALAEVLDISMNGARLSCALELAKIGKQVLLSAVVLIAGTEQRLELNAEIKSRTGPKHSESLEPFIYGLTFVDTPLQQQLLLQALCYELQSSQLNFGADNT